MSVVEEGKTATITTEAQGEWRPKILAFTCRWCTYTGADLAGLNRMKYPADIRLLRVPCSGDVNPQYVLEALQRGCDGVIVCGCHPGDCHYATGNYYAKRRMMIFKRELEYIGLEPDRFQIKWISGAEAAKFRDTVTEFVGRITELGPIEGDFRLEESLGSPLMGKGPKEVPPREGGSEPVLAAEQGGQA
jgi:F420-non-reducing hydrogenase iron-sulfur subunit